MNTATGEHKVIEDNYYSTVYPNPAGDVVYIGIEGPFSADITLQLFNGTGQLVKTIKGESNGFIVQRNELPAGLYLGLVSGLPVPFKVKVLFD